MNDLAIQSRTRHSYGELRDYLLQNEESEGRGIDNQQTKNLLSALNAFIEFLGYTKESEIGTELTNDFEVNRSAFAEHLHAQGISSRSITNQKSLLNKLRPLLVGLNLNLNLNHLNREIDLPSILQGRVLEMGLSNWGFAGLVDEKTNVSRTTVMDWLTGRSTPSGWQRHRKAVEYLESSLGLPEGSIRSRYFAPEYSKKVQTEYGKKTAFIQSLVKVGRRTIDYEDMPEHIKAEWQEFLAYKTDPYYHGLKRNARYNWKVMPGDNCTRFRAIKACHTTSGYVSSSASPFWDLVQSYIGFLVLPRNPNDIVPEDDLKNFDPSLRHRVLEAFTGLGLNIDDLHFVDLINLKYLPAFFRYRASVNRSGRGAKNLAVYIKSLVQINTGFLWQQPALAELIGQNASNWEAYCEEVYDFVKGVHEDAMNAPLARKPADPIAAILSLPNPLSAIFEMEQNMLAFAPAKQNLAYATWLRDLLFIKMLRSNPLRINHFSILRLWESSPNDNKGSIRKKENGRWAYHIPKIEFKNQKNAKNDNYNVEIAPSVGVLIDRYLEVRHMINGNPDSRYFFVGQNRDGNKPLLAKSLAANVAKLTRRYAMAEFRPHAMRHIVATAWLKSHPNDFIAVAHILHDKIETVLKEYAHLQIQDSHTKYGEWMDEIEAQGAVA